MVKLGIGEAYNEEIRVIIMTYVYKHSGTGNA